MSIQKIIYTIIGVLAAGFIIIYSYDKIKESFKESAREELVSSIKSAAKNAQTYYHSTDDMGFGNRSFSGWVIPERFRRNDNGSITALIRDQKIIMLGTGEDIGLNGISKIKIESVVTADSVFITILN